MFNFWDSAKLFLSGALPFAFLLTLCECCSLDASLLEFVSPLDLSRSSGCRVVSYCTLIYTSLITPSHVLILGICVSSLVKCLFKSFPFLNCASLSVVSVLYVFWVQFLYQTHDLLIFFFSLWLFIFLMGHLTWRAKDFNFEEFHFIDFLFYGSCLWCHI